MVLLGRDLNISVAAECSVMHCSIESESLCQCFTVTNIFPLLFCKYCCYLWVCQLSPLAVKAINYLSKPAYWSLPDCPGSPGKVSDVGVAVSRSTDFHLLQWGSQSKFLITQSSGCPQRWCAVLRPVSGSSARFSPACPCQDGRWRLGSLHLVVIWAF